MGQLRRVIASLSMVAILSTLVITTTAFAAYKDVPESHWFAQYVDTLGELGVIDTTKDNFYPDKSINRAELVKMVTVGAGTSTEGLPTTSNYSDVAAADWFFAPVHAAEAAGIIKSGTKFDPLGTSNRAQAAKVIVEAFGVDTVELDESPFSDVKSGEWYYDYTNTVYCYGVVGGFADGTYGGGKDVTKAQFGKMISIASEGPELKEECVAVEEEGEEEGGEEEGGEEEGGEEGEEEVVGGGDLTVSLSESSPDASTLADGTAFNELIVLNLETGTESAKVNELTVTSFGKVSDTYLKISVWKDGLMQGNVVTVSEGKATVVFNTPISIAANSSVDLAVAVNIDALSGSGTVGVKVDASTDIVLDGGTVAGTFPINSPEFGIVDGGTSVAIVNFDVVSLATTTRSIDPQDEYKITTFRISETNSKEDMVFKGFTLFNNGNTADADLANFTVKDQNGEILGTVANADNKVIKIVFETPYPMDGGTARNFDVFVDVKSGSTRTAQLIVQNDFDLYVEGVKSKSAIIPTAGTIDTTFPIGDLGTGVAGYNHITINEGTASISKDNSSPSGDVTLGSNDVILGTFTVQAQGEDIELQKIALDFSNGAAKTGAQDTTGYFDCGTGSTTTGCDMTGSVKVQTESGKTLYSVAANTAKIWDYTNRATYATLSAYHTIKAGATEKINIIGSLASDATYTGSGENVTVGINRIYYYKKGSLKYGDTGAATANSMSVTTSSLTVSSDTSYGAQTVVAGTSNVKIGAFNVKGSSAEKVNVTSIALLVNNSPNSNTIVSNLKLYKGTDNTGTQLGSTQATVNDNTAMTLSISGLLLEKGEEISISAYADISSAFTDAGTATVTVSASGVSGTGQTSQSSASGPTLALDLQTITVNTSGTLTIALADDNPVTKILVAGTTYTATGADVAKFKLSASKAEDIYLKKLTLRTDTNADDSAISGAALYGSTDSTQLGTLIGTVHNLQSDGTRPGYISWDWTSTGRPKITSNSSYFITVKVNVVSSGQLATVSSLTPVIQLGDVEAEGASAISPKNDVLDDIPTIVVLGTFVRPTSGAFDLDSTGLTATATTITLAADDGTTDADATGNGVLDNDQGYYCFIETDEADDAADYPVAGGVEMFYVMGEDTPAGAAGIYQIERGLFNTTAAAITPAGANEEIFCVAAPKGNIIQILNTKLTASTDTTGLDTSAKTEMKLAKIKFTAETNTADAAENKATIGKMRITVTATNADASVFVMYPDEKYNDASYAVTGKYVADSVVEFNFADSNADGTTDTTFSSTVYDDIVEGQSRTYTIKANTVTGTNGSLDIQLAKTGSGITSAAGAGSTVYTATYGSNTDISWSDGATSPTTSVWINQTGTNVALRYFSSASSTGTPDTTAPVISCTASCMVSQTLDGTITAADVHGFTFSEAMSQVTFTDVKMGVAGTITADFAAQGVADGTLFTFATAGAATVVSYTPAWNSSTNFRLTVGVVGGTAATEYEGVATPSATLFMDIYGNAGPTGTATTAW